MSCTPRRRPAASSGRTTTRPSCSLAERLAHTRNRSGSLREAVTVVIALGSIGLGVLVAAASHALGELGATLATIVAWICIVIINVVHARSR